MHALEDGICVVLFRSVEISLVWISLASDVLIAHPSSSGWADPQADLDHDRLERRFCIGREDDRPGQEQPQA